MKHVFVFLILWMPVFTKAQFFLDHGGQQFSRDTALLTEFGIFYDHLQTLPKNMVTDNTVRYRLVYAAKNNVYLRTYPIPFPGTANTHLNKDSLFKKNFMETFVPQIDSNTTILKSSTQDLYTPAGFLMMGKGRPIDTGWMLTYGEKYLVVKGQTLILNVGETYQSGFYDTWFLERVD